LVALCAAAFFHIRILALRLLLLLRFLLLLLRFTLIHDAS
jgi:hypothetical protein